MRNQQEEAKSKPFQMVAEATNGKLGELIEVHFLRITDSPDCRSYAAGRPAKFL